MELKGPNNVFLSYLNNKLKARLTFQRCANERCKVFLEEYDDKSLYKKVRYIFNQAGEKVIYTGTEYMITLKTAFNVVISLIKEKLFQQDLYQRIVNSWSDTKRLEKSGYISGSLEGKNDN